ncbi:hypothetical protein HMPREF1861_01767 [Corynebacterium kroppenstedtii]|nr:hypothetical protein HMPREF1861_01767 [Corynebacterium kroppenstedtii]
MPGDGCFVGGHAVEPHFVMWLEQVRGVEDASPAIADEPVGEPFCAGCRGIGGVAMPLGGNQVLEEIIGRNRRCTCRYTGM